MGICHFYGKPGLSRGSNWIELAFPLESFCRKKGIASEVFLFSPNISASFVLIQTLSTLLDETHSCFSRKYSQTYIKWPLSHGNKTNGDLFTGRFSYAVKWYTLIPSCFAFWKLVLLHLVESPQRFFFSHKYKKHHLFYWLHHDLHNLHMIDTINVWQTPSQARYTFSLRIRIHITLQAGVIFVLEI